MAAWLNVEYLLGLICIKAAARHQRGECIAVDKAVRNVVVGRNQL
jgi:hypothetical protein